MTDDSMIEPIGAALVRFSSHYDRIVTKFLQTKAGCSS